MTPIGWESDLPSASSRSTLMPTKTVTMTTTRAAAVDGVNVRQLVEGQSYTLPVALADRYLERGFAVVLEAAPPEPEQGPSAEPPALPADVGVEQTKPELAAIASSLGLDVPKRATKAELIRLIEAELDRRLEAAS